MDTKAAFGSHRTPPLPEASPGSATTPGRQKEGDKKEDQRSSSPPLPSRNRLIPLRRQASLHDLAEAARSRHARKSRSVSTEEDPDVEQNHDREQLCIKAAKMVWDDLSQVLIWPMNDIDRSDEAMCERVTDLLGPDLRGEEIVLGDPFIAENFDGMSIVEDRQLCGILVAPEKGNPAKVRVADLANLKRQTESYAVGYGEFDVASKELFGTHVMIVKRGQQAVFEGKVPLRFFVRVLRGTDDRVARIAAENAWNFRTTVYDTSGPLWHEFFTEKRR